MKNSLKATAVLMALSLSASSLFAQPWNGFRGPQRTGTYPEEKGLLRQWPEEGPQLLWEALDLGKGYSSPVIVGDRIYVTGMNEDATKEVFHAYTLDGKKIYTTVYGNPWDKNYPETRTTPTVVDGKAYVISGMGDIACIDCKDGKILWSLEGGKKYQTETGNWGTAECPLVVDDKVIYCPGGPQTAMVALNKDTGKEIWKSRTLNDKRNYLQPLLVTYKGKRQIIAASVHHIYGVNPDNGEIQWTFEDWYKDGTRWENIAPNGPVYADGVAVFSQGYGMNTTAIKLADDLKSVKKIWTNDDLGVHHGGFVLVDGVLYGTTYKNNNDGNWTGVDFKTGKTLYNTAWGGGKGKGPIITADGLLIMYDERRGYVGLANANPEKLDVVSTFRFTKGSGPYWAHPVIHDGVLYLRHNEAMAAYKIK